MTLKFRVRGHDATSGSCIVQNKLVVSTSRIKNLEALSNRVFESASRFKWRTGVSYIHHALSRTCLPLPTRSSHISQTCLIPASPVFLHRAREQTACVADVNLHPAARGWCYQLQAATPEQHSISHPWVRVYYSISIKWFACHIF